MIRVAVETQFGQGSATGVGVYADNLVRALRARGDVDVIELCDPAFDLWRFDRRVYWDQYRAPQLARAARADVVHFTGGTLPRRPPRPCVLTLHDLTWLRGANRGRWYVRWYFGRWQPCLARTADALVTDTNAARLDVAAALHVDAQRIEVAGAGVGTSFFDIQRTAAGAAFILAVGTIEERKDLVTAVRAIAQIEGLRLIAIGPRTPYAREVEHEAQRLRVGDQIELRGYVDDVELRRLYSGAAALIFPSRYEGFGLPPLQALAAGLPVIASRLPVLEEVLGDCAWLAPAGDANAFAGALRDVLAGGPNVDQRVERGRIRARQFTWAAVAEKMVAVYRRVARP